MTMAEKQKFTKEKKNFYDKNYIFQWHKKYQNKKWRKEHANNFSDQ